MPKLNSMTCAVFASSILFLTGCQQIAKPQAQANTPVLEHPSEETAQDVKATNQFQLQGKIGVKTTAQSGSAFFTWVQDDQDFDIELTGILGIGKTQISGQPGNVSLNSAKTGLIQAATPEELLQRATGWQAPITHLVDWVQAQPATTSAQTQQDQQNRLVQIIEDGWTVDLSYNEQAQLPNRLILKQALESGKENRITMVIQNR
ncbi:outer membrane lipoprotein LolB [Acinetobacter sp. NCu2D-2]|uniref:lipoprotein insertase outer membrane protein LolB n=1 Tax=Acinetobacter sp. NCu2D-2 TaxID=1608473 RepID=UPI0007CDD426|nr:lipoprotein insertase outer membrane protein LolB [Acinetobacter sp. NCu2D-2]ANF82264.1 outer membrane lipoprotein LolB [Acinetobacter sp. NCu2D-2]